MNPERQRWDTPKQEILNALDIPPRREQRDCHVFVTARVVWEDDGEERMPTLAFAWTPDRVLVEISDARYGLRGAWLTPADVERADGTKGS